MQYKTKEPDKDTAALIQELLPVLSGLGFALVQVSLFRSAANTAQVRLIVTGQPDGGQQPQSGVSTADLARIHRAITPRLELALEGRDLYVEVSSPGTDRIIKEGAEFRLYIGRALKCWCIDTSEWKRGILCGADTEKIMLETADGIQHISYETIAKARLDG